MTTELFNELSLRNAETLADVERLEDWIKADDVHREIYTPSFFLSGKMAQDPRASCFALEDKDGVVFYIRLSRAARVHIQFAPEDVVKKARVLKGLFHGMAFLESQLAHAGAEEWIFDTESPRLKKLCERVLGFTESTHEMVRAIVAPEKKEA